MLFLKESIKKNLSILFISVFVIGTLFASCNGRPPEERPPEEPLPREEPFTEPEEEPVEPVDPEEPIEQVDPDDPIEPFDPDEPEETPEEIPQEEF